MEHKPWIGNGFAEGIDGQRVFILGFSHYGLNENDEDQENFTEYVIETWALKGELRFFNIIAGYFGFEDVSSFLHRIAFANTLPRSVGDETNKFSAGSDANRRDVESRVRRLIREVDADKAIIFTTKGWTLFPHYDDRHDEGLLEVEGRSPIHFGGYERSSGGFTQAYGLRHPQGASWTVMRDSIAAIMAHEWAAK